MLVVRPEDKIRARRLDLHRGSTSAVDSRRKRAEQTLRIRQEQREEVASKRRRELTPETGVGAEPMEVVSKKVCQLVLLLTMVSCAPITESTSNFYCVLTLSPSTTASYTS